MIKSMAGRREGRTGFNLTFSIRQWPHPGAGRLLTGLRCWHFDDFAGTGLQHDESVLAQGRALHGEGGGCTSIAGLEMSVFHFSGHGWVFLFRGRRMCKNWWGQKKIIRKGVEMRWLGGGNEWGRNGNQRKGRKLSPKCQKSKDN